MAGRGDTETVRRNFSVSLWLFCVSVVFRIEMSSNQDRARRALLLWGAALGGLALQVGRGRFRSVDQHIIAWMDGWHSPTLDILMPAVSFFGSSMWAIAAIAGLAAWLTRQRALIAASFVTGFAFEIILRLIIPHWRPDVAVPPSMDLFTKFHLTGFPSGHAFRSAFLCGWFAKAAQQQEWSLARLATAICMIVIGLIGVSRVYLHRHWPSDVLGSWLLALMVFAIVRLWEQAPTTNTNT